MTEITMKQLLPKQVEILARYEELGLALGVNAAAKEAVLFFVAGGDEEVAKFADAVNGLTHLECEMIEGLMKGTQDVQAEVNRILSDAAEADGEFNSSRWFQGWSFLPKDSFAATTPPLMIWAREVYAHALVEETGMLSMSAQDTARRLMGVAQEFDLGEAMADVKSKEEGARLMAGANGTMLAADEVVNAAREAHREAVQLYLPMAAEAAAVEELCKGEAAAAVRAMAEAWQEDDEDGLAERAAKAEFGELMRVRDELLKVMEGLQYFWRRGLFGRVAGEQQRDGAEPQILTPPGIVGPDGRAL